MNMVTNKVGPLNLVRRFDWAERLTIALQEMQVERPAFDWESYNCTSCWADVVETMTGVDLYADFREATTLREKAEILRASGYASIQDRLAAQLPQKPLAFAQRGDIFLVPPHSLDGAVPQESAGEFNHYAVALADPPFLWALTPGGIARFPIPVDCICFGVGE